MSHLPRPREVVDDRAGCLCADDGGELFARGAPDAGQAPEGAEQRAPAAGSNAGNLIELGAQIEF